MAFMSYDQEGSINISLLIFPKDAPPKENYDPDSIEVINPNRRGLGVEEEDQYISTDEQNLKW